MRVSLLIRGSFLLISLGLAAHVLAQSYPASEDRSRFQERLYDKAEPGLLPPSEYIEIAKRAVHANYKGVLLREFSNGIVSRRFYRNAPAADRDMICVAFLYRTAVSGGGILASGFIDSKADQPRPLLLVIMRKDRSKIYVNMVGYKLE